MAAVRRVGVAQLVAVRRVRWPASRKLRQRFARTHVRVRKDRRRVTRGAVIDREQVRAVARGGVAFGRVTGWVVLRIVLAEVRTQHARERRIEPVEPHHRGGSEVAVIVPGPARRHHEIPGRIVVALAVDRGIGALAFHDEAQRVRRVPVRRRDLARQDRLQAGEQRRRDEGRSRQCRVLQHEHAPLGFARGDQLGAAHQERPDVGPAPDRRHRRRAGPAAHLPLPERFHVQGAGPRARIAPDRAFATAADDIVRLLLNRPAASRPG